MLSPPFSAPRNRWITPPPKNGKHGGPLVRLSRPDPLELSYLSWGRRHYGEPSLKAAPHEGWHYFLVLDGAPNLLVDDQTYPCRAGCVSIGDPGCMIGHSDAPGNSCEMLTWIWRTPPSHSSLRPQANNCLRFEVTPEQIRRLKHLHVQCRDAVAHSNERSLLQLRSTRLLLDLCLLEGFGSQQVADAETRLGLALEYMRSHVEGNENLQGLCEYLQMSRTSLYRLFRERLGKGPRAVAQDLRMEWARQHLADAHQSVKSVGYAIGYRHPPDFSRAFKRYFGVTATQAAQAERKRQ